jgi:hypothetical protein
MQLAYFDESGIDGAHGTVLIAGFAARLDHWSQINSAWQGQLAADGINVFHYKDCVDQTRQYKGWNWETECKPHLDRLAAILAASPIGAISAGFFGNWNRSIVDRPDLQVRFPSAYSFCFELMVKAIRDQMNRHGQPDITLIFSEQRTYRPRALDVWNWHRERKHWPEIMDVRYAEPKMVPALQMADMLAYETRRHMHKGGDHWRSLPLLSRLVVKHEQVGRTLYDAAYREADMIEFSRTPDAGVKVE